VGARNVLASIWPVPDSEEVRDIMVDFHAALRDGSAPSLAFRSAIRSAIKQGVSPYYWGGFSVYGT
jgi:CHAT domain-containing protein